MFFTNIITSCFDYLRDNNIYLFYSLYVITVSTCIIIFYFLQYKFTHITTLSRKLRFLQIIVDSTAIPIILFILVQIISDPDNFFLKYLDTSIINIIGKFKSISFLWMCWLGFARFIHNLAQLLVADGLFKITNDKTIISTISKILMSFAYIIMGMMLLNILGLSIKNILMVVGGPVGLLLFAGKTAITDVIGGVSMLMNKSFVVGEAIEIPEKNFKGTILKIGLKKITFLTNDNKILTIPNSILSNVSVINKTQSKYEFIHIEIFIDSDCYNLIPCVIEQIKKMLQHITDLNKKLGSSVVCNKTTQYSGLILEIKVYANTTKTEIVETIKQDIFLKTLNILKENKCYLRK